MDMPEDEANEKSHGDHKRFTYQGRTIVLHDPGGAEAPMMSIDGTDVMVLREETGGFSAPMLNMHAIFPTLEDLARGLIVSSPVFLATKPPKSPKKGGR